jgi:putative transposase
MSHSYCSNYIHIVFSTKGRIPNIADPRRTWKYVAGIAKDVGATPLAIGGMPDHLHALVSLHPDLKLAKAINSIKVHSSHWMKSLVPSFTWQRGYGAFSVSASNLDSVARYIDNQQQHHAKRTFETEFVQLLRKHRQPFDPNHIFG